MERPETETSEDRGYIHVSNLPLADKPISIGWMFSVVGLLPEQASSWVPGRAQGFSPRPATRNPIIYKTSNKKEKSKTAPSA